MSVRLEVSCGQGLLHTAPVRFRPPARLPAGPLELRPEDGGAPAPVQRDGDELVAMLGGLQPGARRRYRLEQAAAPAPGPTLRPEGEHALALLLPEGPFATYHWSPRVARPYFFPVLGPGGKRVTRAYPMEDVPGEQRDHPHHRSLWTAYGEVNDVDNWSEEIKPGHRHGWIRQQELRERTEGPVFAGFAATATWTGPTGKPVLDDYRLVRLYNAGPDRRLLDYEVHLIAAHGPVHYGDTKEGGILAVRVATSMDGNRGGLMENSDGGKTEQQVWGQRANWLDYSGPVEGEVLGIGMMDHPGNLHHPCYWHARDYGLVGTNPFGRKAFNDGEEAGFRQAAGTTLRFRYRLLFHRGGATEGRVDEAYHAWVQPPAVSLKK